jgi:hypothetical protein
MCEHEHHAAVRIRDVTVELIKTNIKRRISREIIKDYQGSYNLDVYDLMADQIVIEFTAFMAGKVTNQIHVDVEYPTNWWEAFKDRWFPDWMLAKWPVKYTRILIDEPQFAICPHLPSEQKLIHYEWLRDQPVAEETVRNG